jgi:hypothetical protein
MQEGRPLAYLSKAFKPRNIGMPVYEKEPMAILLAVDKWRHYLQFYPFVIKTDHESLYYLLNQKNISGFQQKGINKLLGLDYTIQYRKGKENVAVDALSL